MDHSTRDQLQYVVKSMLRLYISNVALPLNVRHSETSRSTLKASSHFCRAVTVPPSRRDRGLCRRRPGEGERKQLRRINNYDNVVFNTTNISANSCITKDYMISILVINLGRVFFTTDVCVCVCVCVCVYAYGPTYCLSRDMARSQ